MTDPAPTPPAPTPPAPDASPPPPADPPGNVDDLPAWARAAITKANNEAAAHRVKVKELEPLAAKARELEDANKSEAEKATEKLSAAEKAAQAAESRAARLEVAIEKGLTPAQAKRLVGTTKEELEADADELLASFTPAGGTPPPGGKPSERLRGGSNPTEEPAVMDPRKLAAGVPSGY